MLTTRARTTPIAQRSASTRQSDVAAVAARTPVVPSNPPLSRILLRAYGAPRRSARSGSAVAGDHESNVELRIYPQSRAARAFAFGPAHGNRRDELRREDSARLRFASFVVKADLSDRFERCELRLKGRAVEIGSAIGAAACSPHCGSLRQIEARSTLADEPVRCMSVGATSGQTPTEHVLRMLVIEAVDPQGYAALSLLREAAVEARALYPELFAPDTPMPTNPPSQERAPYFVAFLGGTPVACAALRPLDQSTVEVRRMYVLRPHRRCGIGRALLAHLERTAALLHYKVLRLESGNRQLPAMALYESSGFRRIAPFGEYAGDPTSVCYEKHVAPISDP
jgi:putative acetyltransferase